MAHETIKKSICHHWCILSKERISIELILRNRNIFAESTYLQVLGDMGFVRQNRIGLGLPHSYALGCLTPGRIHLRWIVVLMTLAAQEALIPLRQLPDGVLGAEARARKAQGVGSAACPLS